VDLTQIIILVDLTHNHILVDLTQIIILVDLTHNHILVDLTQNIIFVDLAQIINLVDLTQIIILVDLILSLRTPTPRSVQSHNMLFFKLLVKEILTKNYQRYNCEIYIFLFHTCLTIWYNCVYGSDLNFPLLWCHKRHVGFCFSMQISNTKQVNYTL